MKTIALHELSDMQNVVRMASESDAPIYVVDGDRPVFIVCAASAVTHVDHETSAYDSIYNRYVELSTADVRSLLKAVDENTEPVIVVDGDSAALTVAKAGEVTLENYIFKPFFISDVRLIELIMRVAFRDGIDTLSLCGIQRRYHVNYLRATVLLSKMENNGVISSVPNVIMPREIIITESEFDRKIAQLVAREDAILAKKHGWNGVGECLQVRDTSRESFKIHKEFIKRVMQSFMRGDGRFSVGNVQRKFSIGYARAALLVDIMYDCGFIVRLGKDRWYYINVSERQFEQEFARLERELEA